MSIIHLKIPGLPAEVLGFSLFIVVISVQGQNLESIGKEKPFALSGGVSLNQIFYGSRGIDNRRDPYSYFLTGNLNTSIYGWSMPVSFALSNQNTSFQQPFNQFSLNPSYKWVTAHVGTAGMTFSPYTLSGHLFRGVGVDLTPGKFSFSAMYGRLQKVVEPDSINNVLGAFQRYGFGFKAGYANNGDHAEVILFRGYDKPSSISYVPELQDILPQENLVLSIGAGKQFFERWRLEAEFASSALTGDIRNEREELSAENIYQYVGGLFTPRTSSSFYNAFKSGINYTADFYTVGVGYERIDPGYKTLGAYFFNNDLENITVNATLAALQGKLNFGVNVGSQRNNLDNDKISTLRRLVSSLNVGIAPSERINITASYSNFQSFTNIRSQFVNINQLTPYDNLDTLNFTQLSQNANLNVNYVLSSNKTKRQFLNGNFSIQDAADKQGDVEQGSGTQFYLANLSHTLNLVPENLTISTSFNYNQNRSVAVNTVTAGPTLAVSKSFFEKKLRATLSSSWNSTRSAGVKLNEVVNLRATGGYSIKKKHNFNLSVIGVKRSVFKEQGNNSFEELTGTLGYAYNFGR